MENVNNEILKVSVKNDRVEVTFKENFAEENYSNEVSKKCSQIVHADLRIALEKLKPHLAIICEQPEAPEITEVGIYDFDVENMDNYVITGYSIGGSDEHSGVTIIGQKLLKNGKVLNLIAPFTKYEDEEGYDFAGDLAAAVAACDFEVKAYLFNQKWGIKQQEFDFDIPDEVGLSTLEDTPVEQTKKNRKKKLAATETEAA